MGSNNSFLRGQLVLVDFGNAKSSMGSEQYGRRPAVVVQNDVGNFYSTVTIVVPITSKTTGKTLPTHLHISESELLNAGYFPDMAQDSVILAEQITTISKERIVYIFKGELLSKTTQKNLNKRLKKSLALF